MGTITPRKRADGSVGYTAQIRIKKAGETIHTEAQTFDRKQVASAWLKKRETELAVPGAIEKDKAPDPPLAEVIDRYVKESEKAIGRTKAQVLRSVKSYAIGATRCSKIRSADIVAFAQQIEAKPQTVCNYLSHLGAVFSIARTAWGYPLDPQVLKDAHAASRHLGISGRSTERSRRPTLEELDRILVHFVDRSARRPSSSPMPKIITFGIFSTRRLEEITRIAWSDLDEQGSRVMVRDMKNPGQKIGNNVWCDLPAEAMRVVQSMPKVAAEIFPFGADAISAAFTRAMAFLAIDDLHFHDLRHDGVSRLFEMGWNIPHVAAVSGHRSWASLKRYTHLRQAGDKYGEWPWLDRLTS